jgi:alcohol dehydrogenase YqhD (iron-dependent ADH family)
MNSFSFCIPTKTECGVDKCDLAGHLCAEAGAKRVLLHFGGNHARRTGLVERVRKSLNLAGITVFELGGVQPNPRVELCRTGIEICRRERIDFILALGGGSVIDSAKCIALGAWYDGDVWNYFDGIEREIGPVLPVGAIVTMPASASENNCCLVINNEARARKKSFANKALYPKFSILDPALTVTIPPYQTAAGAVDILSHMTTYYFTKQQDNDVIFNQVEAVSRAVVKHAPIAIAQPDNLESRAQLMWAATIGFNGYLTVGCESDWAGHTIEHEFGGIYDITHGAGLAIVTLGWLRFMKEEAKDKILRYVNAVFGTDTDDADAAINTLEDFFKSLGMPVRFSDAGIGNDSFGEIAVRLERERGAYGNIKPIDKDGTLEILNLCK